MIQSKGVKVKLEGDTYSMAQTMLSDFVFKSLPWKCLFMEIMYGRGLAGLPHTCWYW